MIGASGDVAIEVLPAQLASDPEWRRRFVREARAASALSLRLGCGRRRGLKSLQEAALGEHRCRGTPGEKKRAEPDQQERSGLRQRLSNGLRQLWHR
jgi:hypothetical protein